MLDNHNTMMSKITKKQTSLALIAVVFATAMIVGTLASVADNNAFARQSINQKNINSQSTSCNTSGGSGISIGTTTSTATGGAGGAITGCTNTNTNNNVNSGSNTR